MSKKLFADELKRRRDSMGLNQDQAGKLVGISGAAFGYWEDAENPIEPLAKRWPDIERHFGIKCQDYFRASIDNSPGAIIATNGSTVTTGGKSSFDVTLTPMEHKVYVLHRKYGNEALLERCIKRLQAIGAMCDV